MPTKKPTSKRRSTKKSAKQPELRSFRVAKDVKPFTTVQFTRQTMYWIILIAFIVVTQLWILKIQMDIASLTETLTSEQQTVAE